jgi:hypothetical protein
MMPLNRRPVPGVAVLALIALACAWGFALGASEEPAPLEPAPPSAEDDTGADTGAVTTGETPDWNDLLSFAQGTAPEAVADPRLEYAAILPQPGTPVDGQRPALVTETAVLHFGDLALPTRGGFAEEADDEATGLGLSGGRSATLRLKAS